MLGSAPLPLPGKQMCLWRVTTTPLCLSFDPPSQPELGLQNWGSEKPRGLPQVTPLLVACYKVASPQTHLGLKSALATDRPQPLHDAPLAAPLHSGLQRASSEQAGALIPMSGHIQHQGLAQSSCFSFLTRKEPQLLQVLACYEHRLWSLASWHPSR